MELKLSVSIGATLEIVDTKGKNSWIKPEVGAEVSLPQEYLDRAGSGLSTPTEIFADLWDNVVGPQFKSVVNELLADQIPKEEPFIPTDEEIVEMKEQIAATLEGDQFDYSLEEDYDYDEYA